MGNVRDAARLAYFTTPLDVALRYSGNRGLDMLFVSGHFRRRQYDVLEAKGGRWQKTLSALRWYGKHRQGSLGYNLDRMELLIDSGRAGRHPQFVKYLKSEIDAGRVGSYASLEASGRLYELPLGWPKDADAILR